MIKLFTTYYIMYIVRFEVGTFDLRVSILIRKIITPTILNSQQSLYYACTFYIISKKSRINRYTVANLKLALIEMTTSVYSS